MDIDFDVSTIGIILSILITIFFSKEFIRSIVDNILLVTMSIDRHETDLVIKKLLEENRIHIETIRQSSKTSRERYSEFERSLKCNITLLFWYYSFVFVMLLANKAKIFSIKDIEILVALIYVMLVPYLFRMIWVYFDDTRADPPQFLSRLTNKVTAIRYPAVYFAAIITFNFSIVDYQQYKENVFKSILIAVVMILMLYIFSSLLMRLFRVYTLNKHEFNLSSTEIDSSLYFLGIRTEAFSLAAGILIALLVCILIASPFFGSVDEKLIRNIIYVAPIAVLIAPLITFSKSFSLSAIMDFLTRNERVASLST